MMIWLAGQGVLAFVSDHVLLLFPLPSFLVAFFVLSLLAGLHILPLPIRRCRPWANQFRCLPRWKAECIQPHSHGPIILVSVSGRDLTPPQQDAEG